MGQSLTDGRVEVGDAGLVGAGGKVVDVAFEVKGDVELGVCDGVSFDFTQLVAGIMTRKSAMERQTILANFSKTHLPVMPHLG